MSISNNGSDSLPLNSLPPSMPTNKFHAQVIFFLDLF